MKIPFHMRLECPASYATDDSMHLQCAYDGVCDGTLYECCVAENEDLAIMAQMSMDEEKQEALEEMEGD